MGRIPFKNLKSFFCFILLMFLINLLTGCGGFDPQTSHKDITSSPAIGVAPGGAKDIANFRRNITENFLPLPTDLTYEGLFYDYYFDTGITQSCEKLFCPSYSSAISEDPFSNKKEYFLSVGLNSNIRQEDFSRRKLNLVFVIDISGSMGSPFNEYYYDPNTGERDDTNDFKTKMESASESLVAMLDHLRPEDSFGLVTFNDRSNTLKPMGLVKDTDLKKTKDLILGLKEGGGTNMFTGMTLATETLKKYRTDVPSEEEEDTRIIFLTDAQPNTGITDENVLLQLIKENAELEIYTSFIGIGVDFNTELIEFINKVRGANHYSVHSPDEFKKRMSEEFDFMVTPLAFDLELTMEVEGFQIKKVYGSPEADEATGKLMKVNTLFPSQSKDGKNRGGIIILHLEKDLSVENNTFHLTANYKDREEQPDSHSTTFELKDEGDLYYDNTGIRKGILLARYANLLKDWLTHEASRIAGKSGEADHNEKSSEESESNIISRYETTGIPLPPNEPTVRQWQRYSIPLSVSEEYKTLFRTFSSYFEVEAKEIGDSSLEKELDLLKHLIETGSQPEPVP